MLISLLLLPQGNVLQHNVSAGVIISESSLVLQRVARSSAGRYTCHASNAEGEGSSSPFHLHVARKSRIFILFFFVLRHYVFQLRTLCNVLKTVWFHVSGTMFVFLHPPFHLLFGCIKRKKGKENKENEGNGRLTVDSNCPLSLSVTGNFHKVGSETFCRSKYFFHFVNITNTERKIAWVFILLCS